MRDISYQRMRENGFFKSNAEMVRFMILEDLAGSQKPMGSWVLSNELKTQGLKTSLATVGRILKSADGEGLTILVNNEGRMITEKGKSYVKNIQQEMRLFYLNNKLMNSVKANSSKQLGDIITVRILLETEAVRRATENLKQEDVEKLEAILFRVDADVENIRLVTELNAEFHKSIALIANNKFISTIMDVLLDEQWNIENSFNVQPKYHNSVNAKEHWGILKCMEERNPGKAVKQMERHLEKLKTDALRGIQFASDYNELEE